MGKKTEFLYLSEEDTIKAGVKNYKKCIDNAEDVFKLLAEGDYLMGGSNHNSHGMGLVFPKESPFPNMPLAGPDRRFVAMPAYLGGRFDVCGCKWYGSNAANKEKELPRSVLTMTLNDKDTGEPLAFMSANLLSAARTGAVPGVATRHLVEKNTETLGVFGCGQINRSCLMNIITEQPSIEKIICYDLFEEAAKNFADWAKEQTGIETTVEMYIEAAVKASDIMTVAASRLAPLEIKNSWIKPGASVLITGPLHADDEFWKNNRIIYDSIGLHQAYVQEAIESGDKEGYYAGVIGGPIYTLIDKGELPKLEESLAIGDVINGKVADRTREDEVVIFVACGMATFDVGLAYDLYQTALEEGYGQKLLLWEEPEQLK